MNRRWILGLLCALTAGVAHGRGPRQIEVAQGWLHAAVARELADQLQAEARVFDLSRPFHKVTVHLPTAAPVRVDYQLDDQASQHWQGRAVAHRREVFTALVEYTRAVLTFRGAKSLAPRQAHVKQWIKRHGLVVEMRPVHARLPALWAELAILKADDRDVILARHADGRSELGVAAGPGDIDAIWLELTELAADRVARGACAVDAAQRLLAFSGRYAPWIDFALAQRSQLHHRPCGKPAAVASPAEQAACGTLRDGLARCDGTPAGPLMELAIARLLRVGTLPGVRRFVEAPVEASVAAPAEGAPPEDAPPEDAPPEGAPPAEASPTAEGPIEKTAPAAKAPAAAPPSAAAAAPAPGPDPAVSFYTTEANQGAAPPTRAPAAPASAR